MIAKISRVEVLLIVRLKLCKRGDVRAIGKPLMIRRQIGDRRRARDAHTPVCGVFQQVRLLFKYSVRSKKSFIEVYLWLPYGKSTERYKRAKYPYLASS